MSKLIEDNLGITFAYEVMQKSYSSLAPFYVKGWNIVRDFNYVYLDSADSLEILETFDNFPNSRTWAAFAVLFLFTVSHTRTPA